MLMPQKVWRDKEGQLEVTVSLHQNVSLLTVDLFALFFCFFVVRKYIIEKSYYC